MTDPPDDPLNEELFSKLLATGGGPAGTSADAGP